ncbi:DUF6498-containing protein [Natronolimnohabitans innermongolicus]|uniref:Uncharacterized protein n=1 Tax=Natronolimnohabitans innermongolicus JCM 12255 TaxID=1227499 RepID=L9X197_9EURY|nr:DUF6498-containing protein [Natronolimnohabitans innermongolicus]ELY55519.1 hypothetical protein C493_11167 [Natronolimnohabitans innermongolicus JCM 12255]
MDAIERVSTDAPRSEAVAVLIAALVPLVGVFAFGWHAATIVTIFWFELAIMCFWALVRALFAGRPSEFAPEMLFLGALADRSVAIPIPVMGLEIRLSTLPVLVVASPVLAFVWFVAGTVTVGLVGDHVLESDALEAVTLAIVVLFLVEGGRTVLDYFYRQGYREHSAQTAIHGVFWRGGVLFFVGLFGALLATTADPSVASDEPIADADSTLVSGSLLVGIILLKLGFDLAVVYRDRLQALDESTDVEIGFAYEPPMPAAVDTSLSNDHKRVRPPSSGRLLATASHARRHPSAWLVGAFPAVAGLLFAFGGVWAVSVGLLTLAVVVVLLLIHVDYWLRYAGVEYRTDVDSIVAYDRLFRTPVWRIEAWDESEVRIERDRIDNWLDTSTVVVELPDRERRLPRLRDTDSVLEVFDRLPRRR